MKQIRGLLNINLPPINVLHDEALLQEFKNGIGRNVLILTPSFPYVFIGKIIELVEDYVVVDVNVTTIAELEKRKWHIHIDQIDAFYIQRQGLPRIPDLKDDFS